MAQYYTHAQISIKGALYEIKRIVEDTLSNLRTQSQYANAAYAFGGLVGYRGNLPVTFDIIINQKSDVVVDVYVMNNVVYSQDNTQVYSYNDDFIEPFIRVFKQYVSLPLIQTYPELLENSHISEMIAKSPYYYSQTKNTPTSGAMPKGYGTNNSDSLKPTLPKGYGTNNSDSLKPTLPKEVVTNLSNPKKSAEELNRLGTEAYQNNNFVYAEECFDEAIKKEPTNPKYYNNLSAVLFQLGGFVKALELVNKSIELRKDANSLNTKCGILFKMGRYDESIQAADEGLKIEPNNPDLFNSKATALAYNFQFEEALVAVDKAIQLVSNDESFSQNKQKIIQCQNWAYQHSQETGISLQDFRNNSRKRFDGNLLDSDLTNNFFRLSWENAEDLVGKLFEAKGFSSNVTPRSGDFGIDVEAKSSEIFLGIQVKHWNADVGFEDVAKTLGVASKFNKVIIVSTKSGFTRQAQEFANEDVNRYRIELWDSSRFKQELRQYVLRQ